MRRRSICALLALALMLVACDPFQDDLSPSDGASAPASGAPAAPGTNVADRVASGGDTLVRGMALLGERYVGGADVPRLLAAGQRGAWAAVAQSGLAPPDVDAPLEQAALTDSLQGFRTRYARTAQKYASKVDP